MTYHPKTIDFTDHADRDEERITIDIDGDTYARLAKAADAAGESVDDVAERALTEPAWALSMNPVGPFSCTHRGHGACADCPTDEQERQWRAEAADTADAAESALADLPGNQLTAALAASMADADRLRTVLRNLLAAYPRLSSEFSTAEQQQAVRAARAALGGNE